jgi:hypothetical protein
MIKNNMASDLFYTDFHLNSAYMTGQLIKSKKNWIPIGNSKPVVNVNLFLNKLQGKRIHTEALTLFFDDTFHPIFLHFYDKSLNCSINESHSSRCSHGIELDF